MQNATVRAERVLVRGEKRIKITGYGGVLEKDNLPIEYTDKGNLRFFLSVSMLEMPMLEMRIPGGVDEFPRMTTSEKTEDGKTFYEVCHTRVGDLLSEAEFAWLLKWMRRAGARLAEINRRLAEENKGWEGEIVEEI